MEVDEDDPAMETPFTDAKAGQKKFGGWKEAGIRYYDKWQEAIITNRKKHMAYLKDVEKEALARIRVQNGLEAEVPMDVPKNANGKRKASEISEEDVDEDDMEVW